MASSDSDDNILASSSLVLASLLQVKSISPI